MKKKKYPLGKTLKRMLDNMWTQNKKIALNFVIFTVFAAILPVFGVILPKLMLGELLSASASFERILYIAVGYLVAAGLCNFVKTYVEANTYVPISYLRLDYIRVIAEKINAIDYKYHEDQTFWRDNQRALSACGSNGNGMEGVYHYMFEGVAPALTMIGFMVFVGMESPVILAGLALNLAATIFVQRGTHNVRYALRGDLDTAERRMSYYHSTTNDFSYGKDIRMYNLGKRILSNYSREIDGYLAIYRKIVNREYALGFVGLAALLLSGVATYGILIYRVIGGMSLADFSMYIAATVSLSVLMKTVADYIANILTEGQYVSDFYDFVDGDFGTEGGDKRAVAKSETLEIEFRDVSFKYPGTDKWIFEHLNLVIRKGERLAIVGVNGAGKSTLVKMMTGLFEQTEGEIYVNGTPIGEFNKKELFSMFSVVFQDFNVLAYTLRENVACTSHDVDDERAVDCLRRAGLGDKLDNLPKGFDQPMLKIIEEDGTEFSGGESQKLAIARALYKDGNMVIMDEPTAALDALAEAAIYESFSDLVRGKTAVYISHRLASTKFCDNIAFFDGSGLAEYGSHDELMAKGGKYREMFTIQGKYYTEGEAAAE